MRAIDLETWNRRELFHLFRKWGNPYFSMCANVDVTAFYPAVKQRGVSFTVATLYIITRAANAIPEFRYRIRGEEVVEHEIVHPSTTILTKEDLFTFCTIEYIEDFALFAARAAEQIACVQEHPTLENVPGRDDFLYSTAIPWVSFTSFHHPMPMDPTDSVPRFAWGGCLRKATACRCP